MNSSRTKSLLEIDEGRTNYAYADPITHGEPIANGIGCTLSGMKVGDYWSDQKVDEEYDKRMKVLVDNMNNTLSFFSELSDARQSALLNIAWNVGFNGLLAFHHMLSFMKLGLFDQAHDECLNSKSAQQLPARYGRIARMIQSGEYE